MRTSFNELFGSNRHYAPIGVFREAHNFAPEVDSYSQAIRERRIQAEPSERLEIISALEQAENKYPNGLSLSR